MARVPDNLPTAHTMLRQDAGRAQRRALDLAFTVGREPQIGRPVATEHIRTAANSGLGMKPDDRFAVPCCFDHHKEYHNHGRKTFERKYGLDLLAEAESRFHTRACPQLSQMTVAVR